MPNGVLGPLTLEETNEIRHDFDEKLAGKKGRQWLSLVKELFRQGLPDNPVANIIRIARARKKRFNPVKFIGEGWSIIEQDENSLKITELDLSKVQLVTILKDGETSVGGEEKQKRLKNAKHIRLDAAILQVLFENQHLIPESWKEKTKGQTTYIFFDGTILRDSRGDRCVLFLYWCGGQWHWDCRWLGGGWGVNNPSVVLLASVA